MTAERDSSTFSAKILKWKKASNIIVKGFLGLISIVIGGLALSEYRDQPTVTKLNVKYNKSVTLPAATVCLPLLYGELNKLNSSAETKNAFTSDLVEFLSMPSLRKSDIMPKDNRWTNSMRNIAHAYLIDLSNCEAGLQTKCNVKNNMDKDLISSYNMLEKIMSQLNISVDELRQGFGDEVASLYSFSLSVYEFSRQEEIVKIGRTKFIGDEQICYDIPFNHYPLGVTSKFKILVDERALPNPNYTISRRMAHITFTDQLFIDSSNNDCIDALIGQINGIPIEITKYRILSNVNGGKQRCGEQSMEQCEATCRMKFIQEQCKCTPTSWPNLLDHIDSVSLLLFIAFNFLTIIYEI